MLDFLEQNWIEPNHKLKKQLEGMARIGCHMQCFPEVWQGPSKTHLYLRYLGQKMMTRESMDAIFPASLHIFKSLKEAIAG